MKQLRVAQELRISTPGVSCSECFGPVAARKSLRERTRMTCSDRCRKRRQRRLAAQRYPAAA